VSPGDFDELGRFARGNSLAALGGRRRQGSTRLATRLGLENLAADPTWSAYRRTAAAFKRAHCAAIARSVGGGVCGPAPSSIVASAALQLAASRYLFDRADPGSFAAASRLADASRQNLLAAHELAAREALARPARAELPPWYVEPGPEPAQDAPAPAGEGKDTSSPLDASTGRPGTTTDVDSDLSANGQGGA
jgi:hypothetical protein